MGEREPVALVFEIPEQQEVDVDGTGRMPRLPLLPTEGALDLLADVEQLLRGKLGVDHHGGVQEVRLVEDLALRRGLVHGRLGHHFHPADTQLIHGRPQVGAPIPYVRAAPEVAPQEAATERRTVSLRIRSSTSSGSSINASTASGSNCVPEPRAISSRASSMEAPAR